MVHAAVRQQEIERAMRAHPAGRALPARRDQGVVGPPLGGLATPLPLRLTARGRRLLLALAVAAGVGLAALGHGVLAPAGTGTMHLVDQASVVVRPGDTLWSIASAVAGDGDVREVVQRIREVNGLSGSDLHPGEVLRLP